MESNKTPHKVAMAAYLAQQAMSSIFAARATAEEAIAARQVASRALHCEGSTTPMQD
jgi:hypothetical protein